MKTPTIEQLRKQGCKVEVEHGWEMSKDAAPNVTVVNVHFPWTEKFATGVACRNLKQAKLRGLVVVDGDKVEQP
jgi:hypothetical protein